MKIRTGFVSNSSTSSFVLCVPRGSTEEQIHAMIKKSICPFDCFMNAFADNIIDIILECMGEKIEIQEKIEKGQELDLQYQIDYWQEHIDNWQDKVDRNFDLYQGGFSNSEDSIQYTLFNLAFKISEDNFFMKNDCEH